MLYVLVPDTFVLVAMPYYAGTCTSRNSVERTQGPQICSSLQKTELSYYIRNTNCIGSFKICLLFLTNYVHYKRVSNNITRSYNQVNVGSRTPYTGVTITNNIAVFKCFTTVIRRCLCRVHTVLVGQTFIKSRRINPERPVGLQVPIYVEQLSLLNMTHFKNQSFHFL